MNGQAYDEYRSHLKNTEDHPSLNGIWLYNRIIDDNTIAARRKERIFFQATTKNINSKPTLTAAKTGEHSWCSVHTIGNHFDPT